ncbi:acyl-CoA dehydrogenase [Streptomyces sp. NPDC001941]|uniref:acyl-CoA dehydrogenase n=1 Tax=Streptomyces sp. NPDC001941 TaxID=3154659 RepID=UPI00332069D4
MTRSEPVSEERAVRARVADLETRFGDRFDPANPVGDTKLLQAAEEGGVPTAARQVLSDYRLGAEFVPADLGGRFVQADSLARVLRTVVRRDGALGLVQGASHLFATAPVWAAGGEEQRSLLAWVLLAGGRAAATGVRADGAGLAVDAPVSRAHRGGHVLDGPARVGPGAADADALVVFARPGVFLLRAAELPALAADGSLVLDAHEVEASAYVGDDLAAHTLRLASAVLPSMAVGSADGALRTAVGFARDHQLLGRSLLDVPHHRGLFAAAFLDLLVADCLSLAATRALHVLPAHCGPLLAAARTTVPRLLSEATGELATLFGPAADVRAGRYGMFGKQLRDLGLVTVPPLRQAFPFGRLGHDGAPAPEHLFNPYTGLGPFDWRPVRGEADAGDPLAAHLVASADATLRLTGLEPYGRPLAALAGALVEELHSLTRVGARLPAGPGTPPHPDAYAVATRYSLLLAGAACLGVWQQTRAHGRGFLAQPAWLTAALRRIVTRLGREVPLLPRTAEGEIVAELRTRFEANRTFDVYDTPLAG